MVAALVLHPVLGGCYHGVDLRGEALAGETEGAGEGDSEPDSAEEGSTGAAGDGAVSTGGEETSGGPGPGETSNGAETGSDTDDAAQTTLAEGIVITSVEVNQGVAVTVIEDGAVVSASGRRAALIPSRAALVRGFWALADDFSPRSVEGRFIVTDAEGTSEVFIDTREVAGPPDPSTLEGGFLWDIPPDLLRADSTFAVEIAELEGTAPATVDAAGARVPARGEAPLAPAGGDHVLAVVVVPLRYATNGQVLQPDLGSTARKALEDALYDQNPVEDLIVTYHTPVDYNASVQNGDDLGDILGFLSSLRSNESPPSHVYYAGLVNVGCFVAGCGNSGTTGVGFIPSAGANGGLQRVSISIWFDPESSAGTVVHEVGHNQGLSHIGCPGGGSSGNDPSYPHPEGRIGTWGYGPRSEEIFGSNAYDYMSYCGPSWASDYTWEKTRGRIETLSASADAPVAPRVPLLAGVVHEDGAATWYALEGSIDPSQQRSSDEAVAFFRNGTKLASPAPVIGAISDIDARWVVVERPTDFDHAQWVGAARMTEIDVGKLDRFDRMRAAP